MIPDVFGGADLAIFPLLSLVLFLTAFICMLFWVNRKGSKAFYEKMGGLPLGEEWGDGSSMEKQA